jgi:hypothetical protein
VENVDPVPVLGLPPPDQDTSLSWPGGSVVAVKVKVQLTQRPSLSEVTESTTIGSHVPVTQSLQSGHASTQLPSSQHSPVGHRVTSLSLPFHPDCHSLHSSDCKIQLAVLRTRGFLSFSMEVAKSLSSRGFSLTCSFRPARPRTLRVQSSSSSHPLKRAISSACFYSGDFLVGISGKGMPLSAACFRKSFPRSLPAKRSTV